MSLVRESGLQGLRLQVSPHSFLSVCSSHEGLDGWSLWIPRVRCFKLVGNGEGGELQDIFPLILQ